MNAPRRRGPERSLLRTLSDTLTFVILLAMVLFAMRQFGGLSPATGAFTAIDGDSLRKGENQFRLHAIDAPELYQSCGDGTGRSYPCGRDAQNALRKLVGGKTLDCRIIETDRYGRSIASCSADHIDINAEMVRLGWAIAYRRHGLDYISEEAEARRARRGIWRGTFEIPEDWRARQNRPPGR